MFTHENQQRAWSAFYWPYYCEECVWKLCESLDTTGKDRTYAVVISNALKQVLFWHQKAAPEGTPILWDYHVILFLYQDKRWLTWDLASRLPCPTPVEEYLFHSFHPDLPVSQDLRPRFRVVRADLYQDQLATDRSHMQNTDGTFRAPPPPWAPISRRTNLDQWIDMTKPNPGNVLHLRELIGWLGEIRPDLP